MKKSDKLSVFISLVLRHEPDAAGITLDEHGWANVEDLLVGINNSGRKIDMETLEEIVKTDSKQRYSFNQDKTLIRGKRQIARLGQLAFLCGTLKDTKKLVVF